MKTSSIKGNVRETKSDMDFQTFVRDLIASGVIKAGEGLLAMSHRGLGHKMVQVDGLPFLEIAETQDDD